MSREIICQFYRHDGITLKHVYDQGVTTNNRDPLRVIAELGCKQEQGCKSNECHAKSNGQGRIAGMVHIHPTIGIKDDTNHEIGNEQGNAYSYSMGFNVRYICTVNAMLIIKKSSCRLYLRICPAIDASMQKTTSSIVLPLLHFKK